MLCAHVCDCLAYAQMCMHVCTYACTNVHACMHVRMHIPMCAGLSVYMHACYICYTCYVIICYVHIHFYYYVFGRLAHHQNSCQNEKLVALL